MPRIKLTKKIIVDLPSPEAGQVFYWDSALAGLGLRITPTRKTFICQKRVGKRTVRVTVGRADQVSLEQARTLAKTALYRMFSGEDINRLKADTAGEKVTLEQAYKEFLSVRELKPSTRRDYDWLIKNVFGDWQRKPVVEITRDMVQRRHAQTGEKRGAAQANRAFRFLRSLLNFCAGRYEDRKGNPLLTDNPVKILSQTRQWFRLDRRQTIIKPGQLKPWYDAVMECPSETIRDFLILVMLTGMRKGEAQRLEWKNIDLRAKTLTIPETKNRKPLTLPLSTHLHGLLDRRRKVDPLGVYVFPGKSKLGCLTEPKKILDAIGKKAGVPFCVHDLRRTYLTTAESLGTPVYSIKMLVNHSAGGDVTAGYIVSDVERLRGPVEKIADRLMSLCKGERGKVIALPGAGGN